MPDEAPKRVGIHCAFLRFEMHERGSDKLLAARDYLIHTTAADNGSPNVLMLALDVYVLMIKDFSDLRSPKMVKTQLFKHEDS